MSRTTVAGAVLTCKDKILICRSTKSFMPDGKEVWGFPKGHYEESDFSLLNTCFRELKEETDLDATSLGSLPYYHQFAYKSKTKDLTMYFFEVGDELLNYPFKCNTLVDGRDYPEIDKYEWVTLEVAEQKVNNHMKTVVSYIKKELKLST